MKISFIAAAALVTTTFFVQGSNAQQVTTAAKKTFKIISVTQAKEYPPAPNTALKAQAGSVFIVVAYVPVPLKTVDDYPDDRSVFLVDSSGQKHGTAYTDLVGQQTINGQTVPKYGDLVFGVKQGVKPQALLVKGLKIDLTKTP